MSQGPAPSSAAKPAAERLLELWLFRARWLMAPFYVGLVLALAALLYIFIAEAWHEFGEVAEMRPEQGILMALSLIDLSLTGNLLLVVIFAGYENFVSRIDTADGAERPGWMGSIDFSGLKIKLVASIVAISGIALLREVMRLAEGEQVPDRNLAWLAGLHLLFVVSGLLLALMDYVVGKSGKH
jgi:uncharacterized protein (TIGR00645 family)